MAADTLSRVFFNQVEKNRDDVFLIFKDAAGVWQDVTWHEVGERIKSISLGLIALGVEPGDRISGISDNRPEYAYCCTAIINAGAIFAPIYQTNSPKECAHVLNDAGSKIAFVENDSQCNKLIEAERSSHKLEKIIIINPITKKLNEDRIITIDQLCDMGKKFSSEQAEQVYFERLHSIKPDDYAVIIYTSGTTGPPKGVVDTHGGVLKSIEEWIKVFPLTKSDRGLSFLPLAHALEFRNGHWFHIRFGFTQVYPQSMRTLFDDAREKGVTFFFTTPRFFERIYNQVSVSYEKASFWKKALINWSMNQGRRYHNLPAKKNISRVARWYYEVLYAFAWLFYIKKIRELVGIKLRYSAIGGAPAAHDIIRFFASCGLPLYEGYGLTESQGMITTNRPGANKIGTIGKPMDGVETKIAEDGELLVNGWIKGVGYWNNQKATEELYKGGWLNTGDLAQMDEEGYLKITGRKKEIIITSGGKNISPSYVENQLKMSGLISQAVVFGEGKDYLTAILTLYEEEIISYAQENHIDFSDYADLIKKQPIIDLIQLEIDRRNKDLSKVESIKKFTILSEEFRQDRGELTPTFKIKRNAIASRCGALVEAMYKGD